MSKKRKSTRRSAKKSQSSFSAILRRPLVQLGILAVAALVIYLLVATNSSPVNGGPSVTVSVDEAYAMYQEGAFVLDVREVQEWNEYHVPGTTLIPLGELDSRINELPRDRLIVVICRSGNRSREGRDILINAGFTQVTSMDGGVSEWRANGYPIEP